MSTKKKDAKKADLKTTIKSEPKKKLDKKIKETKKKNTKDIKESGKKSKIPERDKNLAKDILARNSNKKELKIEDISDIDEEAPIKYDSQQKVIIAKKTDGKIKTTFKIGDFAVYPSHGIGKIIDIEKINILNETHECYLIYFEKEKLTIKTPIRSVEKIGIRHLISKPEMDEVFKILRSGIKKLKGMWSRRAQEYETKINSGDIMLLAEVLRDLTRDIDDSERSYSERIIYETAISRLASEYSAIYGIEFEKAKEKVILTAKDKIDSETKVIKNIDDDDFDNFSDEEEDEEDEEDDEEEDEDIGEGDVDDYDDFDDED